MEGVGSFASNFRKDVFGGFSPESASKPSINAAQEKSHYEVFFCLRIAGWLGIVALVAESLQPLPAVVLGLANGVFLVGSAWHLILLL